MAESTGARPVVGGVVIMRACDGVEVYTFEL